MTKKLASVPCRLLALALMLVTVLTMFPATQAHAASEVAYYNGGLGTAYTSHVVYNEESLSTRKGSVSAHETFTILRVCDNAYYINYSTSNGYKEGYISKDLVIDDEIAFTCVGWVNTSCTVYYYSRDAVTVGSVSAGEFVTVLASNPDGYLYIEYNTNSGRKRGYVPYNAVNMYRGSDNQYLLSEYMSASASDSYTLTYNGSTDVFRLPTDLYAAIGSISNEDIVVMSQFTRFGHTWQYIRYHYGNDNGPWKSGYIIVG